ncbi:hypothetical protein BC829DRAFT_193777 [Chytridium lagenaria]|nr:hypothetical protein BC829DRAFT_193777 [Chytridium lagenaria]
MSGPPPPNSSGGYPPNGQQPLGGPPGGNPGYPYGGPGARPPMGATPLQSAGPRPMAAGGPLQSNPSQFRPPASGSIQPNQPMFGGPAVNVRPGIAAGAPPGARLPVVQVLSKRAGIPFRPPGPAAPSQQNNQIPFANRPPGPGPQVTSPVGASGPGASGPGPAQGFNNQPPRFNPGSADSNVNSGFAPGFRPPAPGPAGPGPSAPGPNSGPASPPFWTSWGSWYWRGSISPSLRAI